jgi:hypothetical protein
MSIQSSTIVQRVWNYCNVLRALAPQFVRGDGLSYSDYVVGRWLDGCMKHMSEDRSSCPRLKEDTVNNL